MKSFEELYAELRKTAIIKMEKNWQKAKNEKLLINMILFGISLILPFIIISLNDFYKDKSFFDKLFFVFIVFLTMFPFNLYICLVIKKFLNRKISKYTNLYVKLFKENIIIQILNNFYTDVRYFPEKGIDPAIYRYSRITENYDIFRSDDYVVAKLKNKYIKLANIKTISESEYDGTTSYQTLFEGLFMNFMIESNIDCNLKIVKNGHVSTKDRLNMDSTQFEKYFDVECDNNVKGMQILTHDAMEQFVKLYDKTTAKFEISIRNNNVFIKLNTGDMYEPKEIIRDIISKHYLKHYYDMIEVINILAINVIKIIEQKKEEIS